MKVNLPFIAPGDALYLQGAYGEGAMSYTGFQSYTGDLDPVLDPTQNSPFVQYFNDAVVNPITGKIELVDELHGRRPRSCTTGRPSGARPSSAPTARSSYSKSARAALSVSNPAIGGNVPPSFLTNPSGYAAQPGPARRQPDRHRREPDLVAGQGSRYRRRGSLHPGRPTAGPHAGPDPAERHGDLAGHLPGPRPRPARLRDPKSQPGARSPRAPGFRLSGPRLALLRPGQPICRAARRFLDRPALRRSGFS